jgi:hypothetical protein
MERKMKNAQLPFNRAVTHEDDENLEWAQRRARARRQHMQLYGLRHFAAEASVNICVSVLLHGNDATPFLFAAPHSVPYGTRFSSLPTNLYKVIRPGRTYINVLLLLMEQQ